MLLQMNYSSLISKPIEFLSKNKGLNLGISFIYYICVVLLHEWFEDQVIFLFRNFSRSNYQIFMISLAGLFILIYIFIIANLIKKNYKTLTFIAAIILLSLVLLSYYFLIIHNIEGIHFLQYAVLGFLMFPLIKNYSKTLFWGILLGFIDEGYQYFYLKPFGTNYYDFNDVILNQLGLGLGLLPIAIWGQAKLKKYDFKLSSIKYELFSVLTLTTIIIVLKINGFLSVYPEQEVPYNLFRELPNSFWSYTKSLGAKYHIVLPLEGLAIIIFLFLFLKNSLIKIHFQK